MCKCNAQSQQEMADAIYESLKAQDPANATPRLRAGIDEVIKFATLMPGPEDMPQFEIPAQPSRDGP
ncbi:hypothetical protein [Sorangium sp. So ce341]|uniref:hypothetical protein n=1 Tax=Sorangium sp. So ce341 TaxID=3133302 RepID=UPI003F62EA70